MHLVDKEDHVAIGLHLVHQTLDPALELPPELGAGHQGGEVQQLDLLLPELGGNLPLGDAQGQPLRHSGFAHAGFADEAGIVLGPAGEDLDHPLDLLLPADDGVQLSRPGPAGEVRAVVLDMLALFLVDVLPLFRSTVARAFPRGAA